jgi:serpin B
MNAILEWVHALFNDKRGTQEWAPVEEPPPCSPSTGVFPEDHNEFALDLYRRVVSGTDNAFFSPFSIRVALAMTFAGAGSTTADEMAVALRFPSPDDAVHESFAEILRRLNAAGDGDYEMSVANSLWGQRGATVLSEFIARVDRYYGGGMNLVDYRGNREEAAATINRWCAEKTKQRIRDIVSAGGLDALTRLVLVNAVYFKGLWEEPFMEFFTSNEPFYLPGGKFVAVPMMHTMPKIKHFSARGYQAVELDYKGGDLSMVVFLPHKRDGLRQLEREMSGRTYDDCLKKMRTRTVQVHLPKFKMTPAAIDLGTQLKSLGMSLAFDEDRADFSGINGHVPPHEEALYISSVLHKAFVEVNEEGTEAAAATAFKMTGCGSAQPENPKFCEFIADHPFIFAIREKKSGVILFLGRVTNPTLEN